MGIRFFDSIKPAFKREGKNRKVKVVFLTQHPNVWPSTESVWKAFAGDPRCDTKIVQLPFFHDSFKNQSQIYNYLKERNIPFETEKTYDIAKEKPDIVFFQNPYDSTRPSEYYLDNVRKITKYIVYIPYALDVVGGNDSIKIRFNLPMHNLAWKIIVRSENYKEYFKKYCNSGDSRVYALGHPKFDGIYNIKNVDVDPRWLEKINNRKVLMWNAHFSINENCWSTYNIWKDVILNMFHNNTDMVLLMRPHPLLFERLKMFGMIDQDGLNKFRMELDKSDNIILDETKDYRQAFKISDGLMTDAGSFLLEYLPSGKPILYLINKKGPGLMDNDLIKNYYIAEKEKDISAFIEMVAKGEDALYKERMKIVPKYFPNLDGKVGKRINEFIVSEYLKDSKNTED